MEKDKKFLILLAANSIYFFSYFQRVAVPGTIFNELQSGFSLSAKAVTGLGAFTLFAYGLLQILAGIMSDRYGGFRTFFIGGILLSVSSIIFSFSYTPAMLFITRAFVGFGASFIFISLIKILSTIYKPEDFPFYLGVTIVLGYSGGIVATYPLERAVYAIGWRNSFLVAGLLCMTFTVTGWPLLKAAKKHYAQKKTFSIPPLIRVLRNIHALPLLISGPINFGIYFLFQSSLGKKFLQDSCNLSSAKASIFTFLMIIANTVFGFLSGYTSRLIGRRKPVIMTATLITLIAALTIFLNLWLKGPPTIFLISYILLAVSAAVSPVYVTSMKELNSVDVTATSVGFLNTICYMGIAFFAYASGFILDRFRHAALEITGIIIYPDEAYRMIFLGCIMFALISFLVSFSIRETG
ncbi:MAG TPA: MFS transporter [bacterium]|nr:MFS transporter [bacterium]